MKMVLRGLLAILLGLVAGSLVNMGLILLGSRVIPAPPGADATTTEGLRASMHLFGPRHFLFPFLAHAAGTLAGAWLAARIATRGRLAMAFIIGGFFLFGGVYSCFVLPAPRWFMGVDLILAYLPMAWLGHRLSAA